MPVAGRLSNQETSKDDDNNNSNGSNSNSNNNNCNYNKDSNNKDIERCCSTFFTISSLHLELSPTSTLKFPG